MSLSSLAQPTLGRKIMSDAKALGHKDIYTDTKKIEIEIGCYASFDTILSEFCEAALNKADVLNDNANEVALKWKSGHVLRLLKETTRRRKKTNLQEQLGTRYQCLRRVTDFVSGMTDN